jgi:CheY-like chemotaxis protein
MLVDDDASIRRFVELALEELPIELITCQGVAEAVTVLQAHPVDLLITDLMMPGQTGFDLLHQLAEHPGWRGHALLAVFSAGLNASMQARLAPFDIWRQLPKPISVVALEACVQEAVCSTGHEGEHTPTAEASPNGDLQNLSSAEQAAVARHFDGDASLFLAFRATCLPQFALDIQAGDTALAASDAAALRRLAHSLKSVLATLGHEPLGALARQLEEAAALADWAVARPLWARLREGVAALSPGA